MIIDKFPETITEYDSELYKELLGKFVPKVIESKDELEAALTLWEQLHFKSDKTQEETLIYRLLMLLIQDGEIEHNIVNTSTPSEMLSHLMEHGNVKQKDLVELFGSAATVSGMVSGKRAISKKSAKVLGEYFHVCPCLFI